jgi:hypothetical protein
MDESQGEALPPERELDLYRYRLGAEVLNLVWTAFDLTGIVMNGVIFSSNLRRD